MEDILLFGEQDKSASSVKFPSEGISLCLCSLVWSGLVSVVVGSSLIIGGILVFDSTTYTDRHIGEQSPSRSGANIDLMTSI